MAGNLGYATLPVIPSVKGIGPSLGKQVSGPFNKFGTDAGAGVQRGVLGGIRGLAGPAAAAIASLGLGKILADSITNASDLQEAGTAVQEIFGSAFGQIEALAAGSSGRFGQTSVAILDAAKSFGVYGSAAGLAANENAAFSEDLIGLSTDLASFFNTDPSQAVEAIAAGLRGESEPLRAYGVLLNDATLKARAMELGIYSGSGALTQQQRILAAQAEIMAQTGVAQGDFARTSDGLANQQRILSAGLTNLSAGFGQLLLPAATSVVALLNTAVLPALSAAIPFLTDLGALIGAVFRGDPLPEDSVLPPALVETIALVAGRVLELGGQVMGVLAPAFQTVWAAVSPLIPQLLQLWTTASPVMVIFEALSPLLPQISSLFSQLVDVVANLAAGVLPVLIPVITQLAGIMGDILAAVLPVVIQLVSALAPIFTSLVEALLPVITAVLGLISPLLSLLEPIIALIGPLLTPLIDLLVMVINAGLEPLMIAFESVLPPILDVVSVIAESLMPIIGAVTDILGGLITFLTGVFTGNWEQAWNGIVDVFSGIWNGIVGIIKGVLNTAIAVINGIIGGINDVASGISDATGGAISFRIPRIPQLAMGADVSARPGGTLALLGEAGQDETVTNLGTTNRALEASTALAERALAGQGGIDLPTLTRALTDALRAALAEVDPTDLSGDTIDRLARALGALLRLQSRQGGPANG